MTEYQGWIAIFGVVSAVVGFACVVIGTPFAIYYAIEMSRHTNDDVRDRSIFYRLNPLNVAFSPSRLNAVGLDYRRKFNRVGMAIIIGWISGAIAFLII